MTQFRPLRTIFLIVVSKLGLTDATPLQIVFTDQPSRIIIGSEVHLTCAVRGGNDPHTTWIPATGLLPLNSHITNGGRTLVITNYDVTDNGQYICVASDGREFAHHIFTLNNMHPETYPWTTLLRSSTTTPVPIRPAPGEVRIVSLSVYPDPYHFGDDVELTCRVYSATSYTSFGLKILIQITFPQTCS
ncbi:uncharacterized protein LOC111113211 isoform X2 [Crassostrea virginica]